MLVSRKTAPFRCENVFDGGAHTLSGVGGIMDEESISTAVVNRVAADKGVEPTHLPPMHDAIDPDALDAVVATGSADSTTFYVEFEFADRIVTIDGTEVAVRQLRA